MARHGGTRAFITPIVVGILAAGISLGRLWLGNHDALTEVIWAEDGVFPLCIEKAGFLSCLADPFAGYLLVLPRLLAGIVALFPAPAWALVTNLLAAAVAGIVGGIAFAVARRAGLGGAASAVLGLIPVVLPIVGLEALNALGSTYMLLLYLLVLVLALPSPQPWTRAQQWWIGTLLLLSALTIPTAGIALVLIVVLVLKHSLSMRTAMWWSVLLVAGLIAQVIAARTAAKPRVIELGMDSLRAWVDEVQLALGTMWPGLHIGEYTWGVDFPIAPSAVSSLVIVGILLAFGLALFWRRDRRLAAVGLLVLSGLVVGAFPSIIGAPNNRYFVVSMMLWSAALVVALDSWLRRRMMITGIALVAVVAVIWWPLVPASWFRSTPAPPWQGEVARVEAACTANPQAMERVIFSPYWPPNWGDALAEPTHPDISCFDVWTWMGITAQR